MSNALTYSPAEDALGPQLFEHSWRVAKVLATSKIIPAHFQGQPEQCMVALALAQSLGVAPIVAMQNSFVVHGTPGLKASFVIALANARGPFEGVIQYEETGTGENLAVRAFAKVKGVDQIAEFTVSMKMAKAEGWTKNPKYQTMPSLMLRYRAATLLARLYCPEVLLGFATEDELVDVGPSVSSTAPSVVEKLNAEVAARIDALPARAEHDAETGEVIDEEAEEARARELERKLLEGATA